MKLKLSWNVTGDDLYFDIINNDLAEWFVEKSSILGNRYSIGDMVIDIIRRPTATENLIKEEIEYITKINDVFKKLKIPLITLPTDWFDQKQLNKLHKDWTETRWKWPKLSEILFKMDRDLFKSYQEMNCHIHLIERSHVYLFRDFNHWSVDNPWPNRRYDWQVSHLYLEYPGHGRLAFEKFQWSDTDDDWERDLNNWKNIDAFLGMSLRKPYKEEPPREFLEWCQSKNLVPHTYTIPLANLENWEKELAQARQIVRKNVNIAGNYFSLELSI